MLSEKKLDCAGMVAGCDSRSHLRSCEILPESQCITTSSFPRSFYGSYEHCTIEVADNNTWPMQVLAFKTGSEDSLMVNGQSYSGTTGPADVVPQGSIEWRAVSHLRSDPPCTVAAEASVSPDILSAVESGKK